MIIWTPIGILTWITVRLCLLTFYSIIALYIFEKHKVILPNPIKNLIYSVSFTSLIVGVWEIPLFIFGAEQGLIWVFSLILYMIPFPIICNLFHIHFFLGKRELVLFGVWCIIASFFSYINILAYNDWGLAGIYDWDYEISFVFRAVTFIFLFLIFRRMKLTEVKTHERFKKWQTAQQHELNYATKQEPQTWKMHSLNWWINYLHLTSISGQGIEIGCGNCGIYNFTPNILGIDSINFRKSNFIQATGEHLPITHTDFAILCNSLDHCQNPEQVLDEVSRITNTIILLTYTHPKIVSFLLSKLDKMHPYHFTKHDLNTLLKTINFAKMIKMSYSSLILWKYAKSKTAKFKLLIMYLLNIHAVCIHLVKKNV